MTRFRMLLSDGGALVPLRLILGLGLLAHGYAKLHRGPAHFASIVDAMGIPQPELMAWATTLIELVGGVAVMLGAAVPLAAIPLVIIMLTAMFGVHWAQGFSTIKLQSFGASGAQFGKPGYELNLVYIGGLLALALSAPTPLSIDRWRAQRSR